jgi:hypothetical protein
MRASRASDHGRVLVVLCTSAAPGLAGARNALRAGVSVRAAFHARHRSAETIICRSWTDRRLACHRPARHSLKLEPWAHVRFARGSSTDARRQRRRTKPRHASRQCRAPCCWRAATQKPGMTMVVLLLARLSADARRQWVTSALFPGVHKAVRRSLGRTGCRRVV